MSKVHICIEVTEQALRTFDAEARRRGVTVQALIENMVAGLIREMESQEESGTDFQVIPS